MKYEWEDRPAQREMAGVAYINVEAVEGAFHVAGSMPALGTLARADVMLDILGDVQRLYEEAVDASIPDTVVGHD